ncbi:MAG: cold-shock protein [Leptolyngbyaceae cyanobacterium MO_188.B28]|nr:cold-shock protein [Leptolyngbyaceae cyanobacterium MO_188.B28]
MPKGTVKWFDAQKGYGFIAQEEGSDLFVHHSEVQSASLSEGQSVEFEVGEGRKGPCAINVRTA